MTTSFVTGNTISPQTNTTQYDCNWSLYPVVVNTNSEVYAHRNSITAILDRGLANPVNTAQLDVLQLCPIAQTIDNEFRQAIQNYHDALRNATHRDQGRDRQVQKTITLSVCSTYDKLVEEFEEAYHYPPSWWDKIWIGICALFTTRKANTVALVHFENEYNDANRREWMAQVVAQEKARIERALNLIEQGAMRCAENIRDARDERRPVHHQDVMTLNQLIQLYRALKPDQPLQLGGFGNAQLFLEGGI